MLNAANEGGGGGGCVLGFFFPKELILQKAKLEGEAIMEWFDLKKKPHKTKQKSTKKNPNPQNKTPQNKDKKPNTTTPLPANGLLHSLYILSKTSNLADISSL